MKKIIGVVVVILAITIGVFVNNKTSENKNENRPIKIGAVVSLTGYAAVDGMHIKNGMDLAVSDLKNKGVNVEIVYEDDATDPKKSISSLNKILLADKPDAVVGPIWSFLIDAALPVINNNKIVTYVPSATSEVVNGDSQHIFYGTYKNSEQVEPLIKFFKENNIKNVAVVLSNDAWGQSHVPGFEKAVKAVGGNIVLQEMISFGSDKEVMPLITNKIVELNPDAVLWTGYDEAGTLLVRKLQEQNYHRPIMATASVMKGLIKRGAVIPQDNDQIYSVDISVKDDFRNKYFTAYNQEAGVYSDTAYDGVMMLVEGIQEGKTGDDLAKYMRDDLKYKGYFGTYDFDANGDVIGGNWKVERLVK